jgi:hypothetical protein
MGIDRTRAVDGACALVRDRWALLLLGLALAVRLVQIGATHHRQPVADPLRPLDVSLS